MEGNYANHYTTSALRSLIDEPHIVRSIASRRLPRGASCHKDVKKDPMLFTFTSRILFDEACIIMSFIFLKFPKSNALVGNRTRNNCLEGNYTNHYTTSALRLLVVEPHIVRSLATRRLPRGMLHAIKTSKKIRCCLHLHRESYSTNTVVNPGTF